MSDPRRRGGCQCGGGMRGHTRFGHFWQRMTARALCIEVTYFHGDDTTESKREWSLEVPSWVWRPRCWLRGHDDDGYGACVYCRKVPRP